MGILPWVSLSATTCDPSYLEQIPRESKESAFVMLSEISRVILWFDISVCTEPTILHKLEGAGEGPPGAAGGRRKVVSTIETPRIHCINLFVRKVGVESWSKHIEVVLSISVQTHGSTVSLRIKTTVFTKS